MNPEEMKTLAALMVAELDARGPRAITATALPNYGLATSACCEGHCPCDSRNGGQCPCASRCACDGKVASGFDDWDMYARLGTIDPVEVSKIIDVAQTITKLRTARSGPSVR